MNSTDPYYADYLDDNKVIQWTPPVFLLLGLPLRVFKLSSTRLNNVQYGYINAIKMVSISLIEKSIYSIVNYLSMQKFH